MPTWALSATADQYLGLDRVNWDSRRALAALDQGQRAEIQTLAAVAERACQPCPAKKLTERLTALGMTMAPNRPPAEATMWLHETARLLSDIAEDVLMESIDELQKRMKFLPTVAEIRELVDPVMDDRREKRSRLDAMRRYLESGQPIGQLAQIEPKRNVMDRRGAPMTAEETEEMNGILAGLGACTRYREDGSRYEVSKSTVRRNRTFDDRPQMPTREDYIAWGVDPAVLDAIESEKNQAKSTS